jgi:hypothetical protein
MNRPEIESAAHSVHREVWFRRNNIWPMGLPPEVAMLDPRVAVDILGLQYEIRDSLGGDGSRVNGAPAAGLLDGRNGIVVVSAEFRYEVQRFTTAHEVGHVVMHPWVGDRVLHRDLPIDGTRMGQRSTYDREADYFAACYLMPRKLLEKEFIKRFGSKTPLLLDESTLFHMRISESDTRAVFAAPRGSALFSRLVANAHAFDRNRFPSLTEAFGVSTTAMAMRLQELGLTEN